MDHAEAKAPTLSQMVHLKVLSDRPDIFFGCQGSEPPDQVRNAVLLVVEFAARLPDVVHRASAASLNFGDNKVNKLVLGTRK
jgi:hypothetical protein